MNDPINAPKWRLRAQMLRERLEREKSPEVRANLVEQAEILEKKANDAERPRWMAPPGQATG